MMLMIQGITQAFPVIEQNTFLHIDCGKIEAPPRRCTSLPARWRSRESDAEYCVEYKCKTSNVCDSEAITDVCTEDGLSACDSASATEEVVEQPLPLPSPPPESGIPPRTALRAKAVAYEPSTPAVDFVPAVWRIGAPDKPETLDQWQDAAKDIVANMSLALGQVECVSRVDCCKDGMGWHVVAHITAAGLYEFQRIQTVGKESLLQDVEASECIYLLGQSRTPFPPTPAGFCASLASMRSTKKACWDYYNKGLCPRGCECLWEHPALVSTVNLTVDVSESMACILCVAPEINP